MTFGFDRNRHPLANGDRHVPTPVLAVSFAAREGSPVPSERVERKLAAILAADVAGYRNGSPGSDGEPIS
jgi:hypothetical protein